MADNIEYKLIKAFDPTKIKVPIKDKFAKLTLSSNKKKPELQTPADLKAQQENRKNVSRNLMDSLCASTTDSFVLVNTSKVYENPLLRSDSSPPTDNDNIDWQQADTQVNSTLSTESAHVVMSNVLDNGEAPPQQLEQTEYMETLQVSADDFSQQVDALSQQVSHLSVNTKNNQPNSDVTINITTSVEASTEVDDSVSCITITDSSVSDYKDTAKEEEPHVSEMLLTQCAVDDNAALQQVQPTVLSNDKVKRIEAFLRDVSFERQEMTRRGEKPADLSIHKQLASADTESMSQASEMFHIEANDVVAPLPATPPRRQSTASDVNDMSKRLADNDTEANTVTSDDILSDNEVPHESPLHIAGESLMQESITIPETSSEGEMLNESSQSLTQARPPARSSSSSSECTQVQLPNINISAKINIKIQISGMQLSASDSETCSSDDLSSRPGHCTPSKETRSLPNSEENVDSVQSNQCQQAAASGQAYTPTNKSKTPDSASDCDNENFLTHAEKLLTQLYGKSWQTPDVMRTLQRTSSSVERKSNTNVDRVKPKASIKRTPKKSARKNMGTARNPAPAVADSFLADFSVFRSNIVNANMDSTHLDRKSRKGAGNAPIISSEPRQRFKYRERRNFATPRTELKRREAPPPATARQERWRQLVDTDSEDDNNTDAGLASDDDEIDATTMLSDVDDDDSSSSGDIDARDESDIKKKPARNRRSQLTYMDLSALEVVEVAHDSAGSPPANRDAKFQDRLLDILRTCRREEKPKLMATPTNDKKTKRKLFTPNVGFEDDAAAEELINKVREVGDELLEDLENVYMPGTPVHKRLQQLKKHLNGDSPSNGGGTPIFKLPSVDKTLTKKTPKARPTPAVTKPATSPRSSRRLYEQFERTIETPSSQSYSFLKSLNECVPKAFCHPTALIFRENYRTKKEELANKLYALYNRQLFSNGLDVPLTWNKKLTNTAGRCLNKKRSGCRSSSVELSEKVLTSAERLRCTLIHEMCHAAAWVFNGEGGHGATWKSWATRANRTFPDLPPIVVCHQYEIEYKYTYQCTLCAAKSHAHSKSKKVEHIRCSYCHGAIRIFLNKKDKSGNVVATPVKEATGFAKFVKDHYKKYKRPDLKHADVMKLLSNEFANLKVVVAK